jgi:hypothetical protein
MVFPQFVLYPSASLQGKSEQGSPEARRGSTAGSLKAAGFGPAGIARHGSIALPAHELLG